MTTFRCSPAAQPGVLFAVGLLVLLTSYGAARRLPAADRLLLGLDLFRLHRGAGRYNLFKKLPFLNLGPVLYLAPVSHLLSAGSPSCCSPCTWDCASRTIPLGVILAALYLGVAGSGVLGLWLSRWIPPRLRARGEEVLYERIPVHRRQLAARRSRNWWPARSRPRTARASRISTRWRSEAFLRRPPAFLAAFAGTPTSPGGQALLAQAQDQLRYMNDQERETHGRP